VQEYKEDPMPQEEPEEHPALPEACLPHVPEETEPVACEEGEVEIAVCSATTNEEPKAVVDDCMMIIMIFYDLNIKMKQLKRCSTNQLKPALLSDNKQFSN